MKRNVRVGLLALAVLGMAGCRENPTELQTIETVRFAESLGVNLAVMTKLPSGVYIQTITPGNGGAALKLTDRWSATYKGSLTNGTVFDPGTKPLTNWGFTGDPSPIEGFQAIVGMTVGEKRRLVIPWQLGYGPDDFQIIPGGSVLVFEVTLTAINP